MKVETRTRLCQIENPIVKDLFVTKIMTKQDDEEFFITTIEKMVQAYEEMKNVKTLINLQV